MTEGRPQPAPSEPGVPQSTRPAAAVVFVLLLGVLAARALISESFERSELPFLPSVPGTTPATTAALDAITLALAAAGFVLTCGQSYGRWPVIGIGLLAAGGVLSVVWAGDRRLALNATSNLLILVLAGLALARLLQADWMRRLVLATALATGCTTGIKCLIWRTSEWQATQEYWQDYKRELIRTGADLNSPLVENYERRLRSGEAMGYQWHPNVTGSYLAMWLPVGASLVLAWFAVANLAEGRAAARTPGLPAERCAALILSAAICAPAFAGLILTKSTGALVALITALLLLAIVAWCRQALRPGRLLALLVACYLGLVIAAAAWGIARGTMPHASLAFRWYYWQAAARALLDAPLTGIGRLNFADAYLLYKPPESAEDVRDPHNLWLTLLVETGPLTLVGAVLLITTALHRTLRRALVPCEKPPAGNIAASTPLYAALLTALAVLITQAIFSRQVIDWPTATIWLIELAAVWLVCFFAATRLLDRLPRGEATDALLAAGVFSALAGAIVHGLVDFALLTPGGLAIFAVLAATGTQLAAQPGRTSPSRSIAAAICGTLLVGLQLKYIMLPAQAAEQTLGNLRDLATRVTTTHNCQPLLDAARKARQNSVLDAAGARQAAGLLRGLTAGSSYALECERELLEEALHLSELAARLNPRSAAAYAGLAKTWDRLEEFLLLSDQQAAVEALGKAAEYWNRAAALQPVDPRTRLAAGRAWFRWWKETGAAGAASVAAGHLRAALLIDAARPPQEVMRLRGDELAELYNLLSRLESANAARPSDRP